MLSSPPPRNTSENTSHLEQFLLKTNWRLTERLSYKQPCEERHTGSTVGREKEAAEDPWSQQGTQKGALSLAQESSLGRRIGHTHIGNLSPGAQHPEDQWDLEGCKKWTLLSHMHKLAQAQSQWKVSRLKTAWVSGQLASTVSACPPVRTWLLFLPSGCSAAPH